MSSFQVVHSSAGMPLVQLESDHLQVKVAPAAGGRIVSLIEKRTGHDYLWRNPGAVLQQLPAGTDYDPNFYGGIDELLPNDLPEQIDGVDCPDHGELWTLPLSWEQANGSLRLLGVLPRFKLEYEREMTLATDAPRLEFKYRLVNRSPAPRHFLWKLHAALNIAAGDVIDCPAKRAQVVDLAWSRYHTLEPFPWPQLEGEAVNVVPPARDQVDFFYLFDLTDGRMTWRRPGTKLRFTYEFERAIFPYAWMFASYGGFNGHYTAILEPCSAMPLSVNDALKKNQCSMLAPGQLLETRVSIRVGADDR